MKRKVIILTIVSVMIIGVIIAFLTHYLTNNQDVNIDEVEFVQLRIKDVYDEDIEVTIDDYLSIEKVISLESFVKKYAKNSFWLKSTPWNIEITYKLKNQDEIFQIYRGQKKLEEVKVKLENIDEVSIYLNDHKSK